jgi:hypothetical protein
MLVKYLFDIHFPELQVFWNVMLCQLANGYIWEGLATCICGVLLLQNLGDRVPDDAASYPLRRLHQHHSEKL